MHRHPHHHHHHHHHYHHHLHARAHLSFAHFFQIIWAAWIGFLACRDKGGLTALEVALVEGRASAVALLEPVSPGPFPPKPVETESGGQLRGGTSGGGGGGRRSGARSGGDAADGHLLATALTALSSTALSTTRLLATTLPPPAALLDAGGSAEAALQAALERRLWKAADGSSPFSSLSPFLSPPPF